MAGQQANLLPVSISIHGKTLPMGVRCNIETVFNYTTIDIYYWKETISKQTTSLTHFRRLSIMY
jgi:hypothetical protein